MKYNANTSLGFAQELINLQKIIYSFRDKITTNYTKLEQNWMSPFMTIDDGLAITALFFIFVNQFMSKPQLRTDVEISIHPGYLMNY